MDLDPRELEGDEAPATASSGRAAYWVDYYERLVPFEESILTRMEELAKAMPPDRRRAVEVTNLRPMRELIADLRQRAEVWRFVTRSDAQT